MNTEKLGLALGGFGAGVQGNAPQFFAQKAQEKQALSKERRGAMATDNRNILFNAQSGNTDRAMTLINNRLGEIDRVGGDPASTEYMKVLLEENQIDTLVNFAAGLDQEFVNEGTLQPFAQPQPLSPEGKLASDVASGFLTEEQAAGPESAGGMASAVTKIRDNGTSIAMLPDGNMQVKDAGNNLLEGQAAIDAIKAANDFDIQQGGISAAETEAMRLSIKRADDAFGSIASIRENISTLDEARQTVIDGAETGFFSSRLPAFKQATREFRNVQSRLGLGVISSTTFGALSEGELRLALATALPGDLEGPALIKWIDNKQAAQEKLAGQMANAAIFLGTPGNTTADWLEVQKEVVANQGGAIGPEIGEMSQQEIQAEIADLESRLRVQ